MLYYYSPDSSETQGPVSEDALKNLYFQRRIALGTPVLHEGITYWRTLADYFPDLEFYRECPKCHHRCSQDDAACPNCGFQVDWYLSNCRDARKTTGTASIHSEEAIKAEIERQRVASSNSGCYAVVVIIAIAFWFVPMIGPILTFITLVGGISGVAKSNSGQTAISRRKKAIDALARSFSARCPHCNVHFQHVAFSEYGASCPHCRSTIREQNGIIYWVPHFEAALTNDLEEYFRISGTP